MKQLAIIAIALFVFQSCSVLRSNQVPDYTNNAAVQNQMVEHQPMRLPADTTRQIVVYNVIEKDDKKLKITDETIRMFIGDLFGTITTILTIQQMEQTP